MDNKNEKHEESFIILHVEDDHDHAEIVKESFSEYKLNYRLIQLNNGEDALNYLNRKGNFADTYLSPVPNLILLDLRMPKIDGLEVLKEIKEDKELKKIPVVILSSSSSKEDIIKSYELNANSYLVKPLNYDMFNTLLQKLSDYWLKFNKTPTVSDNKEKVVKL